MYRVDLKNALFEIAGNIISVTAVFGSYAFIAYHTVQGSYTLGDLVMYYQAFQRGQGFLREFLGGIASLYDNNLFLSNLYEFLDLKTRNPEPAIPKIVPNPMQNGIKFEDVWFRYPQGTKDVIRGVNIDIKPGEVVALVGENGSGKTTLVKLLCRLYTPSDGNIKIDNIKIDQFSIGTLRQNISVIFQDYVQYNLTARENIWLGNIDADKYDIGIEAAADHAGISEKIMSLPNGYDTILGKLFAKGEELSIGQWQKVALARAFFRDSQVIVLDEPTSAMDPKAEYEVFMKFRDLLEGRTAILISHRLSTVRMADHIYVLNDGQVLESGSHDELVESNGVYAQLFLRQAQNYQ
jgi:ATP-binding cassette subfamily B protein